MLKKNAGFAGVVAAAAVMVTVFAACSNPAGGGSGGPPGGPGKTLTGIEVTKPPTKTEYEVNEATLNTAGMEVTAFYSDSTANAVTEYSTSGFDTSAVRHVTITVEYQGKTDTFSINVVPADAPKVATPVADPPAGTVSPGQKITLTTTTEGAEIWYSTDGQNPVVGSEHSDNHKYTGPFAITILPVEVRAIAIKDNMHNSDILTAAYLPSEPTAVTFTNVTQDGSYANPAGTTTLTLTFDKDIAGLTADNISFDPPPASPNVIIGSNLTKTGTGVYTLTVSGIVVTDYVDVTVSAPNGYTFTGETEKEVTVHKYLTYREVSEISKAFTGSALPTGSVSDPHIVKLIGVNAGTDLNNLYNGNTFSSKFHVLDLSGCTGTTLSIGGTNYSSRSKLVGAILPDTCEVIAGGAFGVSPILRYVTIPQEKAPGGGTGFREIADNAFGAQSVSDNTGAVENGIGVLIITLPATVTRIGSSAFRNSNVKSVIIHKDAPSFTLGSSVFNSAEYLESITLPASLTTFGTSSYMFNNCRKLTSITCHAATPPGGTIVFGNVPTAADVRVPASSVASYRTQAPWNAFTNIQAITP